MRAAVYFGSRHIYDDMHTSCNSLLAHTDVDKVYFLIEDDKFPYPIHPKVEVVNISKLIEKWFTPESPNWSSQWTYIGLIRGALSKVFPQHDRILSIDCDTIVATDISELWDIPLDDYYFAGVKEPGLSQARGYLYCNAGVIMVNLKKMRDDHKDDEIIHLLQTEYRNFVSQDALNELCVGHILQLPGRYNHCLYTEHENVYKILHFAGGRPYGWRDSKLVQFYRDL